MTGLLDRIYEISPVWMQQVGVTAYGIAWKRRRYGGRFPEVLREFISREKYSRVEWTAYQTQQLRQLLTHSQRLVPYYREAFSSVGLSVQDLGQFKLRDLLQLPLVDKETIRAVPSQFMAANVSQKQLHTYLTSGSTGTPLAINFSSQMHQSWTAAYEARCRRWAGVNHKMKRAMIGGRVVVPKAESRPPFWRYNLSEKQLYMSAFHISPANAKTYVEALNSYKPDYLVGYASSHFFLARLICEMGLVVHRPKAVLVSSEKLTDDMRQTIQQAYGCQVFDGYSGVEVCCLASECEYHQLHVSPDVGLIELLDKSGVPVASGEVGEIVATGFLNFAQPLIRYRTGDEAIASNQPCPCGRNLPVLKELVGRLEDTVIGADGREMVRFHGIFVGLPKIRQGQVVQKSLSDFTLRLVVDHGFDDGDRHTIQERMKHRLGKINLTFEYVDRIESTERGKMRAVISHVRRTSANSQPGN
jgi:phenylacetate-coenzyme A ligase PaaK-like adenylate-forming protein